MLLQSGTAFHLKDCYKVGQGLLQSGAAFLLQSGKGFCYKVGQDLLQSGTGVTN